MAQVCCIGVGSCPILGADGKSRQGRFLFLYPFLVLFDYKDTIKREKKQKYFDFPSGSIFDHQVTDTIKREKKQKVF
jgi:hypothetical protein